MGKLEWGSVLGVAGEELEGRNQILTFAKKVDVQFFRRESVREESDYALSLLFFSCYYFASKSLTTISRGYI